MYRVLVLVEGSTEETFITEVLAPHFAPKTIYLTPTQVRTNRQKKGAHPYKGGVGAFERVRGDLGRLLNDTDAALVTMMIDFYRLGSDFPGVANLPSGPPLYQVSHCEQELDKTIGDRRFLAYYSLHEFEALLFAAPDKIIEAFPDLSEKNQKALRQIRQDFNSPEEINLNSPPSKRIAAICGRYDKILDGNIIALSIGMDALLTARPHFAAWIAAIETRVVSRSE